MTPLKFLKQCLPLWVKQAVATTHNYITISNNLLYIQLKNRIHRKGKVTIGRKTILKNCHFKLQGSINRIVIGENCKLNGLRILLQGNNNMVHIGNNVIVNASKLKPTVFNAVEGAEIYIGNGCLFSNNIEMHTSDYHSIMSCAKKIRINSAKNIHLGERVWIGFRSIILKGARISSDTIVGAGSVVTGHFEECNTIIAGNPANIKRRSIFWSATRY